MTERGADAATSTRPDAAARGARPGAAGSPRLVDQTFGTPESPAASLRAPVEPTAGQRQLRTLLAAFRRGERLTVAGALGRLQIYALSQRVGELRKQAWPVQSRNIYTGHGAVVKQYWIER